MKNKFLSAVFILPSLLSLVGCGNSSTKAQITYGKRVGENEYSLISLTYSEFNKRMDPEGDLSTECFLLLVLPQSCTCRYTSAETMESFSKTYQTAVYSIENTEFKNYESYGVRNNNTSTLLYIIDSGKIVKEFEYKSSNAILKDLDYTHKQITKYADLPTNYFYTSESYLDSMISNKESFIVEYIWSSCSDCLFGNPNILWKYGANKTFKNVVYVLDIGDMTYVDGQFDKNNERYVTFLNEHYLTETSSPEYGYSTGKVPTLQHWTNGVIDDSAVIFNDVFEKQENGKYKIVNSFYSEARKDHLKYLDDSYIPLVGIETQNNYDHSEMLPYYKPLIEAFLDYYVMK